MRAEGDKISWRHLCINPFGKLEYRIRANSTKPRYSDMDEQRIDAYIDLIQALLNSPGQKNEILQAHPDLVDWEFVQVMKEVAALIAAERGYPEPADWLREIAAALAAAMEEQRIQAYRNLIDALLECPSGQENEILQAHPDLVDSGLVQEMEEVAAKIAEEGERNASWLRRFAARLAVKNSSASATWEDYGNFLVEVLQAVRQNCAPEAVYPLLEQNLDKLDENLWRVLQASKERLQQMEPETVRGIVADIANFSIRMSKFPLGNRVINIEIAIAGYEIFLTVFPPEEFPQEWATIQNRLGNAYRDRIARERRENIERAISCYNDALTVYTRSAFPVDWARIHSDLGNAYINRIAGERRENIERAISCYNDALTVKTRSAFPVDWAVTQNNLGVAYSDRIAGERYENIERAICCFNDALEVRTRSAFPVEWAMTQNNLGSAYCKRIAGDISENIEKAICCFNDTLTVTTSSAFPFHWAGTKHNLGVAYSDRIAGDISENIEKAIACYLDTLEVYTRSAFPVEWARTQNSLGSAYKNRIARDRSENIEKAICCYNKALTVYTRSAFPVDWAGTQNNLGLAYLDRIAGYRSENIERAICCFNDALEVITRSAFPVNWAMIQNNLGLAYRDRIAGDRGENIERAIACYHDVMEVRTRSAFPVEWATTQNNLGSAYKDRIAGDRGENIERAISCYHDALKFRTPSAFPVDWARTQNNLGTAYSDRIAGDRSENIERAIACYHDALKVYTPEAFPLECLKIGSNLGKTAFTAGFWETAIAGYAQAIEAVEKSRAWATTEERRQEILKESIGIFKDMVQAYVNTGQLDKALEYVERSRSKRLADLIAHNDLYAKGEIPPEIQEIIDKINQLQQQIDGIRSEENPQSDRKLAGTRSTKCDKAALAALNEEIAALEAEKLQLRQQLYKLDPAIAGLPLNFTQLQNLIDQPTTAILSFYTTDDHTHIFILRQNQITCHTCPGQGRKTLQDWIRLNWLLSYINIGIAEIFAAAKILRCRLQTVNSVNIADDQVVVKLDDGSEQFIAKPEFEERRQQEKTRLRGIRMKKMHSILKTLAGRLHLKDLIAQHLEGISELILIPHLHLHMIPLAALPLGEGEYLGDKFLIRTLPSCQILDFCHQNPALDGNLTMGTVEDTKDDLPFSNWEAQTVAQQYDIPDRLRLKKEKAKVSEYQKLLQQVNSLLSTHHAQSRLDNPLESALILADGKITLGQMLTPGWRFPHLEEVFLSCCETNLADMNITDDILTIAIGFLCAGARSVICTLWAVDDLATAIFSIYYHQYRKGSATSPPLSRPEALQKAQQQLRVLTKSEVQEMISSAERAVEQRADEVKKNQQKRMA